LNSTAPIGIFDSGVGGTSIWKEIVTLMPHESTRYLADSKHAPYGAKSPEQILELCIKNTEKLIEFGAKIIVVACNTATTNAIDHLRSHYDLPFIGIEPAIKPAALESKNGIIGILATQGTLNSKLFVDTSERFARDLKRIEVVGSGLVPLIEDGALESPELEKLLTTYLSPMIEASIDHLVLGCSHYPYLIPLLTQLLPDTVAIIDSGQAVAKQTQAILQKHQQLATATHRVPTHTLYSNTSTKTLETLVGAYTRHIQFQYLAF
jgi:glutamate racemase